ncbi:iron-containing alcohol dehydrogenase [Clostridium polynesiense]|uniref:iron-containing alcohol dehydrogenase n=1 Tax=Clostridium polynesiense TaxID=1325933 RepID=UPI001FA7411A|nr:iron-containing alcohol dehydrogenase [Clostridium polynesiense]
MFCGENAIEGLKNLQSQCKKAYIVMSGTILKDIGSLKIVTDVLEESGFQWRSYTDIEPEPSFQSIIRGAEDMKEFGPDWIIGFGGGSAMDAAKAMWVFYENPEYTQIEDVLPPNEIRNLKVKARIACIPTSAGTGSEATRAALIRDPIKKKKYSIRCMNGRMIPDVAILDPIFTVSMPKSLTAASGMDAITHSIESYVTPLANPYSDAMAVASFINGYENIAECYENGSNMEARTKMLVASCMGGIAFSNCALGLVHSIAHTFGAEYNIPHGLANAIVLPYVIEFNSRNKATKDRYEQLAHYAGIPSLLQGILDLRKRIEIPSAMKDVVPNDKDVLDRIDLLVEKSLGDVCTPSTPVKPTEEELRSLILKVYFGE